MELIDVDIFAADALTHPEPKLSPLQRLRIRLWGTPKIGPETREYLLGPAISGGAIDGTTAMSPLPVEAVIQNALKGPRPVGEATWAAFKKEEASLTKYLTIKIPRGYKIDRATRREIEQLCSRLIIGGYRGQLVPTKSSSSAK
jgi:hypothetical protein